MQQPIEYIRVYLDSLEEINETVSLCFVTDHKKFTFVSSQGLESMKIKAGMTFTKNEFIQKCFSEKKTIISTFRSSRYSEIIKGLVFPIIEKNKTKGVGGIILSKYYSIKDIVNIYSDTSTEDAFAIITGLDSINYYFYHKNIYAKDVV